MMRSAVNEEHIMGKAEIRGIQAPISRSIDYTEAG